MARIPESEIERLKKALSNSQAATANARNEANEIKRHLETGRVESIRAVADLKRQIEEITKAKDMAEQDAAMARNAFNLKKMQLAQHEANAGKAQELAIAEIEGLRTELSKSNDEILARKLEISVLKARPPEKAEPAPDRVALELIALRTEIARLGATILSQSQRETPEAAPPAVTPEQEADALPRAMVIQAQHMHLRGERIAAIAGWA